MNEITENDKLMAALCYPIVILMPLIILISESMKVRPFQKYHAVQALALWVVIIVVGLIFTAITFGCGGIVFPVLWLVSLYPAFKAYQGEYLRIPVITDFIKKQGWA